MPLILKISFRYKKKSRKKKLGIRAVVITIFEQQVLSNLVERVYKINKQLSKIKIDLKQDQK